MCLYNIFYWFLNKFFSRYFPHRIHHFSSLIEENSKRLPYFLLSLRVLPISPNWAMNICCGVLDVPILTFFLTVLIGLMPYNYICVTTGVLVSKLTSISEIFTWTTMIQMTGIAVMAILPAFLVKQKKHQGLKLPWEFAIWEIFCLWSMLYFYTLYSYTHKQFFKY